MALKISCGNINVGLKYITCLVLKHRTEVPPVYISKIVILIAFPLK